MLAISALLIIPISFLAFLLKSVATFGPGVVLVPLGALLLGAREIVIVIGVLDLISNTSLLKATQSGNYKRFWLPMALAMISGSVVGASVLVFVPASYFESILGVVLLPLGLWLVITHRTAAQNVLCNTVPDSVPNTDIVVAAIAGGMGGLAGITGPVLAWHLGRRFDKEMFRRIMIPVLFSSALVRVAIYAGTGLITKQVMFLVLLALPGLVLGLWAGNRLFARISQKWFTWIVGLLISLSGIKLLLR